MATSLDLQSRCGEKHPDSPGARVVGLTLTLLHKSCRKVWEPFKVSKDKAWNFSQPALTDDSHVRVYRGMVCKLTPPCLFERPAPLIDA